MAIETLQKTPINTKTGEPFNRVPVAVLTARPSPFQPPSKAFKSETKRLDF
jgi:hypothetical protein